MNSKTEEIERAIHGLHSGKALGPNGVPIELYKAQSEVLAPHLLRMFSESRERGCLPENQRLATIVTIHKEGKPKDDCASYRPISLLNAEVKILAKLLATRLVPVVTKLVHADQAGFMPKRNTALNLRRLHSVMGCIAAIKEDAVVLSLDAKMAFDSIEWKYMLEALRRMGLGQNFLSWITLLYTEPLAQVKVNGKRSRIFGLQRGTRQGCPLSPLIFALVLEPLAVWIRGDPLVRGLRWSPEWEDRISLYADDILLYLADPETSIDRIMHIIQLFGQYSGYSINWGKSNLFLLHGDCPRLPPKCPIRLTREGFKYLGIFVTPEQELFYTRNLQPPLTRLKSDVAHWKTLPLSLLGRAALFKMMTLPRFLYVLHNTPYPVHKRYFAAINGEIRGLLWEGGSPRISRAKLAKSWYEGGIALPEIQYYYWAAQLTTVNKWAFVPESEPSLHLDRQLLQPKGYLRALYDYTYGKKLTGPTGSTVGIWHQTLAKLGWTGRITLRTPLWDTKILGAHQ